MRLRYLIAGVVIIQIFVFLLVLPAMADEQVINKGDTLSLEDCIDIAISKNPNITLGNNITKVYQSKIGQAKASYFPQIDVSSGYSRQNQSTSSIIDKTSNQYLGSVGVNQLIFDFGKTPTRVKIQDLNFDSSKLDVDDTIVQVAYNVKQAYYSALSAKAGCRPACAANSLGKSGSSGKRSKVFSFQLCHSFLF